MEDLPSLAPEYSEDLLTLRQAEALFKMSRNTLDRFRRRHGIKLLTGKKVHKGDIIAGFEAERKGRRILNP